MKASAPQVKGTICTDPNKPLYPQIEVDSEFWFSWLKEPDVKLFHFENDQGKFTARKEGRDTSTNDYWYAYRKVQGKLRKLYLGAMDELTGERLNQVATEISQPELEYRAKRESYPTKKERSCVTKVDELSPTITSNSYPSESKSNWVTNDSELQALKLELNQVRSQLAVADQEVDILRTIQGKTDQALVELIDKIDAKDTGYKNNGFSQGIKDIKQLAQSRSL
jgi:hypothetical protein